MTRTALIVGATGVVGQACLRHFVTLPGWKAIGIARRPLDPAIGAAWLQLDLQDRAACQLGLSARDDITDVIYAAVYEQPGGLVGGWHDQQQMQINLQMLRNVIEPLDRPDGPLQHVTIMQGGKAYGIHIHAQIAVPARGCVCRVIHMKTSTGCKRIFCENAKLGLNGTSPSCARVLFSAMLWAAT